MEMTMKHTLMLTLATLTLLTGCSGSNGPGVKMPVLDASGNALKGLEVKGHKCELTTQNERKDILLSVSEDKKTLMLRDFTGHRSVTAIGAKIEKFQFLTLTVRTSSPLSAVGVIFPEDKASVSETGKFVNAVATVSLDAAMNGTIVESTTIQDEELKIKSLPPVELGKISACEEFVAIY
jgi:hypothetical protein